MRTEKIYYSKPVYINGILFFEDYMDVVSVPNIRPKELEEMKSYMRMLIDCFVDGGADYLLIDGRSSNGTRNKVNKALEDKIIKYDPDISKLNSYEQCTAMCYRLTVNGKRLLGVPV